MNSVSTVTKSADFWLSQKAASAGVDAITCIGELYTESCPRGNAAEPVAARPGRLADRLTNRAPDCVFRLPPAGADIFHARLSHPYLRRAAPCRCRPCRAYRGLGPPQ